RKGRPCGWSPSTVRDALLRRDYRGELVWGRRRKRDAWGAKRATACPQDDWVRVPAPHPRIFPVGLAAAIDAPRGDQQKLYLRGTRGQLQSKPVSSMASKYLLTGLATCGVCGGSFGPRLAAGRSRHQVYRCLVNHTRGPAVCPNSWQVPVATTDTAV